MLIKVYGIMSDDYLYLGFQTNPTEEDVDRDIHYKARSWAPKNAKSYTIKNIKHTSILGRPEVSGHGSYEAYYFTTLKEGEFPVEPIVQEMENPLC